jgi:hypothetical protein
MDTNLFAIVAICGIYGVWRVIEHRRQKLLLEAKRARVAWMLWMAAGQMQ